MTPERLAELERVLTEIEAEEERRCIWAAVERHKLEKLKASQKLATDKDATLAKPAVRKKGGWVFVANGKILSPKSAS